MNDLLERIKAQKCDEARQLFELLNIKNRDEQDEDMISTNIPNYSENTNDKKENETFHWTRLSINSNIGFVIE